MKTQSLIPIASVALALALAPLAAAGTADSPELTDDVGDCEFAPGNEYMDVVSAWISDESASDFLVNLALAKWTDGAGHGAAFTVQFTHQATQWGVVAFHDALMGGWSYETGLVTQDGDASGFNTTTGTFTPGEPAVLSITFPKSLFPHTQAMDHALTDFWAGSIDFKTIYPQFITAGAGAPWVPVPPLACDVATGDGTYTFQTGEHSMDHMGDEASGNATGASDAGAINGSDDASDDGTTPANADEGAGDTSKDTPAPALALALGVVGAAALAARRRDRA